MCPNLFATFLLAKVWRVMLAVFHPSAGFEKKAGWQSPRSDLQQHGREETRLLPQPPPLGYGIRGKAHGALVPALYLYPLVLFWEG